MMRTRLGVAVLAAAVLSTSAPGAQALPRGGPDLREARATVRRLLREAAARPAPDPAPRLAATTAQPAATGAPENVTVDAVVRRAYLTWSPPSGATGVTGYRVFSHPTIGNGIHQTEGTSYTAGYATPGLTYSFQVAAVTAQGVGTKSAPVSVRIPTRDLFVSHEGGIFVQASRDGRLVPVLDDAHVNTDPAVSLDGMRVAYVSDASGTHGIYYRPATGGGPVRTIAVASGRDPSQYAQPSWAPDGSLIAATRYTPTEIASVLLTTGGEAYEELADSSSPSFTPGASIVAVDEATSRLVEHTMAVTGSRRVITGSSNVLDAEVSPDGTSVAFTRVDSMQGDVPLTSVWLVPRYGGTPTRIADPGGLNADVTWANDGGRVYFTHVPVTDAGPGTPRVHTVTRTGTGHDRAGAIGSTSPSSRAAWPRERAVAPHAPVHVADFDGDGVQDVAVFRPSTGTWYVRGRPSVQWGAPGAVPAQADYDGDGRSDYAVFRPSNGGWYLRGRAVVPFGRAGDVPVPADYDGDGRDDIALFRPSNLTWYVRGQAPVRFGHTGDIPVPGGVLGTRPQQMIVWQPSDSTWYVREQAGSGWTTREVQFGTPGDIPVLMDTGSSDPEYMHLGVLRPSSGRMYDKSLQVSGFTSEPRFNTPMETYGAVPVGRMRQESPMQPGRVSTSVLFQPATGRWTGLLGHGPVLWGQQGDVAV
jgi:hypothetical protein